MEREVTDLDIEFTALAEQIKLTSTLTPEKKHARSVQEDVPEDEVGGRSGSIVTWPSPCLLLAPFLKQFGPLRMGRSGVSHFPRVRL